MARLRGHSGLTDRGLTRGTSPPSGAAGVTVNGPLATCRLASTMNVPADDSLVLIDKPIYLMEADVLRGGASAASTLELFASFEVINDA